MKITLVNVQNTQTLFQLLNACTGSVSCCGVDLRHNAELERLICSMEAPETGIPQLELTVSEAGDVRRFLRYMREGGRTAA